MSTPAASPSLPADLAAAHAMILAERARRIEAEAAASGVEAMIAHLKLTIEKLRRELYGQRSERSLRPLRLDIARYAVTSDLRRWRITGHAS